MIGKGKMELSFPLVITHRFPQENRALYQPRFPKTRGYPITVTPGDKVTPTDEEMLIGKYKLPLQTS